MDPYLERSWLDVHHALCTYARDQVQKQLGAGLKARLGERLVVETPLDEFRAIYPDVRVFEHPRPKMQREVRPAGVSIAEPLLIEFASEVIRQAYIDIIDIAGGGRVITVIEFLSPTNKLRGDGRKKYRKKQAELHLSRTSLVEIDLTRTGRRRLLVPQPQIPVSGRTTYQACVYRGYQPTPIEVYRIPLREPLPNIPIPLRAAEPDVVLQLQPLIDAAYENGSYEDIDYTQPPEPPLGADDATWADELLRSTGKR